MLQPRGYLQRISSPIWLEVHPQIPTRQPVLFLCRQEPVKLASEARQRTWRFLPSCRNTSEGKCDVAIKSPQGEAHNYSLSNSPELASWVQFPSASSFFRALSSTSVASAPPPLDRYCRFDLPAVVEQLFGPFRSLFRGNIDEEKSLSLVAIQPG